MAARDRQQSRTADARGLIVETLQAEGEQESDMLDGRVASKTGLAAKTVKNIPATLAKEGLVKNADRPRPRLNTLYTGSGLFTPNPTQIPSARIRARGGIWVDLWHAAHPGPADPDGESLV